MSGLFIDAVETVNGRAVEQVAAQQRAEGFYGGFARRDQLAVNETGWWQHIDQQIAN